MGRIITSIRIEEDIKEYSKIAARREGYTFTAYYENLLLFNLKENHSDLYTEYLKATPSGDEVNKVKNQSAYVRARFEGREVKDIAGVVLSSVKEGEELEKDRQLMKKKGLL